MPQFDRVPPQKLLRQIKTNWQQGQHVAAIGPTGCGKTRLVAELTKMRRYVVVLGSKLFDDTYSDHLMPQGFKRYADYAKVPSNINKVMLWPTIDEHTPLTQIYDRQRAAFRSALDRIFYERGWTVVLDELHYLCKSLHLEPEAAMFHHQGRSSGLSMVSGFQRPAHVPMIVYSSASHVFIWKTTQLDIDAKRLMDFGGASRRELLENLSTLEPHEFIYMNPVTQAPPIRSKLDA